MTKEEAREILEDFIGDFYNTNISLPIFDQIIKRVSKEEYDVINEYSFRYLLKVAYDLKDK